MSWKLERAMKTVLGVFKQKKTPVMQFEIDALKELNSELENRQKSYVEDNFLFLKLFSVLLKEYLKTYRDINVAKNMVLKDLLEPLPNHISEIEKWLNQIDIEDYFKSINLPLNEKHDLETEKSKLKEHQQKILEKLKGVWSYQKIEKSLYNTVNDSLKDMDNYA